MSSLPKPEVILTHESDLDGLVAGVLLQRLAKHLFGSDVRLEAYHYHAWRQREPREAAAWVTDMSFEPRLDKPSWVIIDHHATEIAPRNARLIHDLNKSAGLLVYDLCREQGLGSPLLDRLLHLNNVSDLFLDNDPEFILANDYANLVKVYGFWSIHALIDGELEKLLDHPLLQVMELKRKIEDPLGLEWSRRNVVELAPNIGFVDTVIGNNNMIVHQLLEQKATPYNVLVTLFRRPNGLIIASLRSRNGEAIKVAEKLQGGGHANASGATLPKSILQTVLNPPRSAPINSLEGLFSALDQKR
jgi:oligoribonuclease NrnB/cAMP/cGMP phosphodiesterase (DHH superfamily)